MEKDSYLLKELWSQEELSVNTSVKPFTGQEKQCVFVKLEDIKEEVPDLFHAEDPKTIKWEAGSSSKVNDITTNTASVPFSNDIKLEPPDPDVKYEISSSEDDSTCDSNMSLPGSPEFIMVDTSSIKAELDLKQENFEMKLEEEGNKKEELIIEDTKNVFFKPSTEEEEGKEDKQHNPRSYIKGLQCEHCNYNTKFMHAFRVHMKTHNNKEWFQCPECIYKTRYKNHLKQHLNLKEHLIVDDDNIQYSFTTGLQCRHCNFNTKFPSKLRAHLKIHLPALPVWFQCKVCGYKTKYKNNLRVHFIKLHNPDQAQSFSCTKCDFQTKYKSSLKGHLLTVHKDKWFGCKECGFNTKFINNLRTHLRRHNKPDDEIEWFRCNFCSFKTKYKSSLIRHLEKQHKSTTK